MTRAKADETATGQNIRPAAVPITLSPLGARHPDPREVCADRGLVDKQQPGGIKHASLSDPASACSTHPLAAVRQLAGFFLRVIPWRSSKRQSELRLVRIRRLRSSPTVSTGVRSGCWAIRSSICSANFPVEKRFLRAASAQRSCFRASASATLPPNSRSPRNVQPSRAATHPFNSFDYAFPSFFGVTLLSQSHQLAALVGIAAPHGARLAAQAMLQVLDWHFLWAPDDWPDQPCYFFCSVAEQCCAGPPWPFMRIFHASQAAKSATLRASPVHCLEASIVAPKCQQRRQPIAVCSIICWRRRILTAASPSFSSQLSWPSSFLQSYVGPMTWFFLRVSSTFWWFSWLIFLVPLQLWLSCLLPS